MTIRIGGVPYGVGAPLLAGLASDPNVAFVAAPPTELIRRLRATELDAALVSSIEAVQVPGYRIAGGLGIACKHEIRSVRAFRRPGRRIRSVGLDQGSATSVALLRLLLAGPRAAEVEPEPTFAPIAPTTSPDQLPHDLVLLIGDAGLAAEPGERQVWDLGAEWVRWTGLPFVFALWLMAKTAAADAVLPTLWQARERGRGLGPVDGTHGAAHYELDADDERGVRRFWAEARALQLATQPDPPFLHPSNPSSR